LRKINRNGVFTFLNRDVQYDLISRYSMRLEPSTIFANHSRLRLTPEGARRYIPLGRVKRRLRMVGFFRAIALMSILTAATSATGADLEKFVGHWSCKGNFSSGAPIAAELIIDADGPSGALIVRHDDVPPGEYHSLEVWMPNKSGTGLRAALADKFSGMRWLESTGWVGDVLTWVRLENGTPAEQFAYELKVNALQVQWSIAKAGSMRVGDTITCNRG
jgi:hypothetical protein